MKNQANRAIPLDMLRPFGFYEFFAGGGMARTGLGAGWQCLFANDFDAKKAEAYRTNFAPANEFLEGDIAKIEPHQLESGAMLAWASFPCQDLSLAGNGKGLKGDRSGVFWSFWKLMRDLNQKGNRPPIIALENVTGLITSHGGADLESLIQAFSDEGYRVGALAIDAALFVPQSRPRLFIVAVRKDVRIASNLISKGPSAWHPESLRKLINTLPQKLQNSWVWWRLPEPEARTTGLVSIIEADPEGVEWHTKEETKRLLSLMSDVNLAKVTAAKKSKALVVGTLYKRTREGIQRAEVRFDGISGCLRTPSGGSSRQIVLVVDNGKVKTRLISPRETARLMGLSDSYKLPAKYNDAYHLTGDGVAVPAVSWLESHLLTPLAIAVNRLRHEQPNEELVVAT